MSKWNFRLIDMSDKNGGDPWLELCEVHYNDKGIPVGYSTPCMGSETVDGVRLVMDWHRLAVNKPVLKKADFVGKFDHEQEGSEDDARMEDEAQFASYVNPPVRSKA